MWIFLGNMCGFLSYDVSRCAETTQRRFFFSGSPESGDDFEYLYYCEKIQIDNFKRVFSKNYVKKRSGPVFGRFKGGFCGMFPEESS